MREIKFRAWDKKEKMMFFIGNEKPYYSCEHQNWCFNVDFNQKEEVENRLTWDVNSDDWEIMQYTGLKDKNGKEIYEGDIIKCKSYTTEKIFTWPNVLGMTGCGCHDGWGYEIPDEMEEGNIKIIGNIYENPELLK